VFGEVGGGALVFALEEGELSVPLDRLRAVHDSGLAAHLS
jgi:hypothetical protein